MHKNVRIYLSNVYEASFNLALEKFLFETCQEEDFIFYLWQNESTIVIGRHQNPYKECNIEKVKADGVDLVRRPSGGGAVYHDKGNLNFTFISHEKNYDLDKNYSIILDALKVYGIYGQATGRNDLTIGDVKFSGNAFMSDQGINCHHGTLLVNADTVALQKYLTPSPLKIKSKGVDSVKSRVINLRDLNTKLSTEGLKNHLIDSFYKHHGKGQMPIWIDRDNADPLVLDNEKDFYGWEWCHGMTPAFDLSYEARFPWGILELDLNIQDSLITHASINTDCILCDSFEKLAAGLKGKRFLLEDLIQVVDDTLSNQLVKNDIIFFLQDQIQSIKRDG